MHVVAILCNVGELPFNLLSCTYMRSLSRILQRTVITWLPQWQMSIEVLRLQAIIYACTQFCIGLLAKGPRDCRVRGIDWLLHL
jgi:hypothetical protein